MKITTRATLTWTLLFALAPLLLLPAAGCDAGEPEAGGGDDFAARMAEEHEGDTPTPSEAATAEPAAEVAGEAVTYATVNGEAVTGYLARPAGAAGPLPGLIVIHEWWGLNDNIRAMAERLAAEGYAALAVDLYGGQVAEDRDRAYELMSATQERAAALEENLRQAHAWLAGELGAPKVGVLGWCFGGGWSLRAALALPGEIDATVIYYGRLETDPEVLKVLDMPILGLFGAEDQGIPVDQVRTFEKALNDLGKDAHIQIYEGADHAFANPSGTRYNPEAAEDAWRRVTEFLEENLK